MRQAFALLELLVVVTVIAILAMVALPGFERSRERTKLSRVRADQRSIATALEAYYADHSNHYPCDGVDDFVYMGTPSIYFGPMMLNNMLTTPVPYLTVLPTDPYDVPRSTYVFPYRYVNFLGTYGESSLPARREVYPKYSRLFGEWVVFSMGPDSSWNLSASGYDLLMVMELYDPTNGLVSKGDIVWSQLSPEGQRPPPETAP